MDTKTLRSKGLSLFCLILSLISLVGMFIIHTTELTGYISTLTGSSRNSLELIGKSLTSFIKMALVGTSIGLLWYAYYKEKIEDPAKYAILTPMCILAYFLVLNTSDLITIFFTLNEQGGENLISVFFLFLLSLASFIGTVILFKKSDFLDIVLYLKEYGIDPLKDEPKTLEEVDEEYDPMYDPEVNPDAHKLVYDDQDLEETSEETLEETEEESEDIEDFIIDINETF